jgi:membrane-associated phospholipid phosphatase
MLPELTLFFAGPQCALLIARRLGSSSSLDSSSSSSSSSGDAEGGGAGAAAAAGGFLICSWFATQILIEVLKTLAGRARPAVCLEQRLEAVPRALPQLQVLMRSARTSHASFPSGDAAGGMLFAFAGYALAAPGATIAVAPTSMMGPIALRGSAAWGVIALLCSYGRVFFHAHHVGDVTGGAAIAAAIASALLRYGGGDGGGGLAVFGRPAVVAAAQASFTATYLIIQRLKKMRKGAAAAGNKEEASSSKKKGK